MSSTMHMDTEVVLAIAKKLKDQCVMMDDQLRSLCNNLNSLPWEGSASEQFKSEISSLQSKFATILTNGQQLSSHLEQEVREWLGVDQSFTENFKQITIALAGLTAGAGSATFAVSGAVLGTSTTAVESELKNIEDMSWSERFAEQEAMPGRIAQAEAALNSLTQEREQINKSLDDQIAYWTAKKAEMEKLAKNPLNKIPGNFKGDSASDIYQKEVDRCDQVLASLQKQREKYNSDTYWNERKAELETRISDLKIRQAKLDQTLKKGIKSDGPTTDIKLAGCAKYVAEKRNLNGVLVPGKSDACNWDNHAKTAGFEVGDRPIPGSIMVLEPENGFMKNVDAEAGHVVYIEKVTPVDGGYKITYSQASTPRDPVTGKWTGAYTYTNVNTQTKFIADGANGVSYIYDKQSG